MIETNQFFLQKEGINKIKLSHKKEANGIRKWRKRGSIMEKFPITFKILRKCFSDDFDSCFVNIIFSILIFCQFKSPFSWSLKIYWLPFLYVVRSCCFQSQAEIIYQRLSHVPALSTTCIWHYLRIWLHCSKPDRQNTMGGVNIFLWGKVDYPRTI